MWRTVGLVLGVVLLILGLFGATIKARLYASEPRFALLAGVLVGPYVLGLLNPFS